MKLGLVITANNFYRHLGPLAIEAKSRGWEVSCLHFVPEGAAGKKTYRIPRPEDLPGFLKDSVRIVEHRNVDELHELVETFDAIIGLHGPGTYFKDKIIPKVLWYIVQHGKDGFQLDSHANLGTATRLFTYTDNWIDWLDELLEQTATEGKEFLLDELRKTSKAVGSVEHDAVGRIDREAVIASLGLDPKRKIITYLPNSPCAHKGCSPWCRAIYRHKSRWQQMKGWISELNGNPAYLGDILAGCSDQRILEEVRRFADRMDAQIILKTRPKTPPYDYEKKLADAVDVDSGFFPSRFLEVAAVSEMVIGFSSTSVLGAAALGIPYLHISLREEFEIPPNVQKVNRCIDKSPNVDLWRGEGFIFRMTWKEVLAELNRKSFEDFRVSEMGLRAYQEKHLGKQDRKTSSRIMEQIESDLKLSS